MGKRTLWSQRTETCESERVLMVKDKTYYLSAPEVVINSISGLTSMINK